MKGLKTLWTVHWVFWPLEWWFVWHYIGGFMGSPSSINLNYFGRWQSCVFCWTQMWILWRYGAMSLFPYGGHSTFTYMVAIDLTPPWSLGLFSQVSWESRVFVCGWRIPWTFQGPFCCFVGLDQKMLRFKGLCWVRIQVQGVALLIFPVLSRFSTKLWSLLLNLRGKNLASQTWFTTWKTQSCKLPQGGNGRHDNVERLNALRFCYP